MKLLAVLLIPLFLTAAASAQNTAPPPSPKGIQGLWVWESRWVDEDAEQARLIDFCQRHRINRLLMQIHLQRDGDAIRIKNAPQLAAFIAKASQAGIAVEALDGAADQALGKNQPATLAILDAILAFNAALPEGRRLVGMHYDIEPYVLPEWQDTDHRKQIILDLLGFFTQAKARIDQQAPRMTLACDIPMWYDGLEGATVEFNGKTKNVHEHIQDICDYIGIMSYRRHATGPNSVTDHVTTELAYAESIGKTVCPALETVKLTDTPQITFFGQSAADFWTTHNQVREALADRAGFGGMLTHSYESARPLLDADGR